MKRPDYAQSAIDKMLETAKVGAGSIVCDIGAGAAHLTIKLAEAGLTVYAVEPNDAMRANGIKRTKCFDKVQWSEGVGECTGMEDSKFDLVTFGSSFNVCERMKALAESRRILKERGWFACMWNHRDLSAEIESIFKEDIAGYDYGTRRQDQTDIINESGLFDSVVYIEGNVTHRVAVEDFIEGWKFHGTLQRQSKEKFELINCKIRELIESEAEDYIQVPYTTRIWMAQAMGNV